MTKIEIEVPPDVEMRIAHLVNSEGFVTQERAVEELLSMGLEAYHAVGDSTPTRHRLFDGKTPNYDEEYVF